MEICSYISSGEIMIILLAVLVIFVVPIIALVDILKSDFEGNNKIVWVLVVLLSWLIGAIIYFIIGRNQKIEK